MMRSIITLLIVLLLALVRQQAATGQDGSDVRMSVWELRPYRIRVLLSADWSPAWTTVRLRQVASAIEQQAVDELGQRWRLQAGPPTDELRRAILTAASGVPPLEASMLDRFGADDKLIVVLLRSRPVERSVQVWELDTATARWKGGRRVDIDRWDDIGRVIFEDVVDSVSSLAFVKQADGADAVLRVRGAMLPIRNPRRESLRPGAVFQIGIRNPAAQSESLLPYTFLVAKNIDDFGVSCRLVSKYAEPLKESTGSEWLAIETRPGFDETEFALLMSGVSTTRPLSGFGVWTSEKREGKAKFIGRTNKRGVIVVPKTDGVAWLRIQCGTVRLADYPVVAGWKQRQQIHTPISPAVATHAATLADCRDDVAQLVALRNAYEVRCKHRESAGHNAAADKLREEAKKVLEAKVQALREEILVRRNRINSSAAPSEEQFKQQWTKLTDTLNRLLKIDSGA